MSATDERNQEVPVARDGSWFGEHLRRTSGFTIGPKGAEQKVTNFAEALQILRAMEVPKWRRPNPKGYWGIVAGVRWVPIDEAIKGLK